MASVSHAVLSSIGGSVNGNDSFTKILLHMDGSNGGTVFTDSAAGGGPKTWTAGGTGNTSTAASKFGGSSLACGAGAGWISTPDSVNFTLGANNWTVDCWFNRQGGDGTRRIIFGQGSAAAGGSVIYMELDVANKLYGFSTTSGAAITGTTVITTTGWHHAALVRTGNTMKMFLDGVQEGGDVAVSGTLVDSTQNLSIGRLGDYAPLNWNGYIDEFRLSVGIARWTAGFTPPTSAYS